MEIICKSLIIKTLKAFKQLQKSVLSSSQEKRRINVPGGVIPLVNLISANKCEHVTKSGPSRGKLGAHFHFLKREFPVVALYIHKRTPGSEDPLFELAPLK